MPAKEHRTLISLQAFRAFAAIIVLLFHASATIGEYFQVPNFGLPFSFGHSGVNFFFVLSGFLIFFVHHKDFDERSKLRNYSMKRLIRIYPSYWILFLFACTALIMTGKSLQVPQDSMTFIKTFLLLPQDPQIIGDSGAPVIGVAWSLQDEMVFYAVFAVFIFSRRAGYFLTALLLFLYVWPISDPPFWVKFLKYEWTLLF